MKKGNRQCLLCGKVVSGAKSLPKGWAVTSDGKYLCTRCK